jgi:hypothetical protein
MFSQMFILKTAKAICTIGFRRVVHQNTNISSLSPCRSQFSFEKELLKEKGRKKEKKKDRKPRTIHLLYHSARFYQSTIDITIIFKKLMPVNAATCLRLRGTRTLVTSNFHSRYTYGAPLSRAKKTSAIYFKITEI